MPQTLEETKAEHQFAWSKLEDFTLRPLTRPATKGQNALLAFLALVFLIGIGAWVRQLVFGLTETGLGVPIFWGVYIVNFVFFIGISHAGTLLSAILRIVKADWRAPFTRLAEMITITSIPFAATCVIVDMGRPDRFLNVILYPHFTSPILWDVCCITTYIIMSSLYFYTALIPDLALCRDRLNGHIPTWRMEFYHLSALGWTGSDTQKRLHHKIMTVLSIVLLALVISVHTNVGFVFGMTIKPGWHTAIIGPYFVIGAAEQGLGVLGLIAVFVRRVFRLHPWLTEKHLDSLRQFTLALTCFWGYFTGAEILTTFYGNAPAEMQVLWSKIAGPFWWSFWGMILGCFVIPFILLAFRPFRLSRVLALSGLSINIGMWLERYTIVVPSGANPFISFIGRYFPSWTEWTITAGWIAGFLLLLLLFMRLFPILTVWEIEETVNS
jgi:molybdopterin-containing oxidoreductase family membrane subunit